MKLGLDLRGGVHFLMEVDVGSVINRRVESYYTDIRKELMNAKIYYTSLHKSPDLSNIMISFENSEVLDKGLSILRTAFAQAINFSAVSDTKEYTVRASLHEAVLREIRQTTVEQTATTLRNRINELGVAEALVQAQGLNRIIVELPGIQDTARAKDILGKTATLEFLLEDAHNSEALQNKRAPAGSKLFTFHGRPILLKNKVILTGDAISGATSGFDKDGRATVAIRLSGNSAETSLFRKTTMNNIGKNLGVVYIETKVVEKLVNKKTVKELQKTEKIISYATIQSELGNQFQITGLKSNEAKDLALLLRAGALPATVSIVEERIIGPSMGQENISLGLISAGIGLSLVCAFMMIYYHGFGLIANIALLANLVLLIALMSLIGATLTLPGIAGIVLTLGMAVDANVLIFERIREELRSNTAPQLSIYRGFECAFSTILDSNLTTLIAAIILFSIGSGPVKGFAVTLSLGILTSLFTAVTGSRAIINLVYGTKDTKKLSVGI